MLKEGKIKIIDEALWLIFPFFVFALLSILKYYSLHSSIADLGYFNSNIYAIAESNDYSRAFDVHIQPYMIFYSWVVTLFDGFYTPIVLLSLQAFCIAIPAYWLRKEYGKFYAIIYLLYFPVWFNVLFDFHMDHLVVPILFYFFISLDKNNKKGIVISALALCLVKEVYALQCAFCGIYAFVRNKDYRTSLLITLSGLLYFYFVTKYINMQLNYPAYHSISGYAFSWLGSSYEQILLKIITEPWVIINELITTPDKIIYLLLIFGALLFIPLFKLAPLITIIPVLAISLLSRNPNYYGWAHHYTAGLIAPIMYAFILAYPIVKQSIESFMVKITNTKLANKCEYGLAIAIVMGHIMISPSPVSRLFITNKIWNYGYSAYIPSDRDSEIKRAIEEKIDKSADKIISAQNTLNWHAISGRNKILIFPNGVPNKSKVNSGKNCGMVGDTSKTNCADYIVLDEMRPVYMNDQGCDWQYGQCKNMEIVNEYNQAVADLTDKYIKIYDKNGFKILKRMGEIL